MKKSIYVKYNRTRIPQFQTYTKVLEEDGERYAVKGALLEEALSHIQSFSQKYKVLCENYKNIMPIEVQVHDNTAVFPFINGLTAAEMITRDTADYQKMLERTESMLEKLFEIDEKQMVSFQVTEEFKEVFGEYNGKQECKAIVGANIDLIFDNFIFQNEKWYVIDYEWVFFFPIPIEFVKFRALYYFYHKNYIYFGTHMSVKEFLHYFLFNDDEINQFIAMDDCFQQYVHGEQRKNIYTRNYEKKQHNIYSMLNGNAYLDDEILNCKAELQQLKGECQEKERIIEEQARKILSIDSELARYKGSYEQMINSISWKATKPIRLALNVPGCIREHGWKYTLNYMFSRGKMVLPKHTTDLHFADYNEEELKKQRKSKISKKNKFSIIVPLFNTPEKFLCEMIESVIMQTYDNWELCLADGSDEKHKDVGRVCKEYQKKDKRIKYTKLEQNGGISINSNACISMAEGDYIGLFDHDDILHLSALYECVMAIENQNADYIYTDEMTFVDSVDNVVNVHYKPDYSPDTLRSYNYICHFSVFKKKLLDEVGGFDKRFDGSQDYDLILKLTEKAERIVHIPKVLYFWRAHEKSVAQDISAKPYTMAAAKKALAEHLDRIGLEGEVVDSRIPSVYKINYKIQGNPKISILIPNKDHIDELKVCITSIIKKSTYKNIEIIVIENNSVEDRTFQYYDELQKQYNQVKIVNWDGKFNYAAINNYGFDKSTGQYILFLNNDVEIISESWIEEMLMFAQRKDVGAVGAMLYYPDDTIQHAGVILGIGGVAGHSHKYFKRGDFGYASRLALVQNLSAVTAACLLIKRDIFEEIEGFDESFEVAFNDVDLCMRIREKGYLNVFTPYAELYHYESKSRGLEDTEEKQRRFKGEVNRFMSKWGKQLEKGDPFYNPNLSLIYEDFSFKK